MILILHRFCHLISRFCLFIYFAFIHRIHKFIIRKYTNTCEIERLILSKNLKGLILSIKRSKELPKLRKALLSSIISSEDLEELYKIKNIPRNQPIIENAFKKINNLLNGKEYIEYLRKTAYDSNNIELEDKLMDLWKMLRPEKKIQARISKDWIEIGFQGDNPATDFRGAGCLGLENLYYFIKNYNNEARFIWETSCKNETQFFFCSAGLFITLFVWELMQEGKIDDLLLRCENKGEHLDIFGKIYSNLFIVFNNYYRKDVRSLMEFNKTIVIN